MDACAEIGHVNPEVLERGEERPAPRLPVKLSVSNQACGVDRDPVGTVETVVQRVEDDLRIGGPAGEDPFKRLWSWSRRHAYPKGPKCRPALIDQAGPLSRLCEGPGREHSADDRRALTEQRVRGRSETMQIYRFQL